MEGGKELKVMVGEEQVFLYGLVMSFSFSGELFCQGMINIAVACMICS